jgi:hypothetical protein
MTDAFAVHGPYVREVPLALIQIDIDEDAVPQWGESSVSARAGRDGQ